MKKEKKSQEKKQHSTEPRIAARFVSAVLAAALAVNGYYAYTMFGKGVVEAANYQGMNTTQKTLQQERESREQAEEETGYISYTPSASTNDLSTVIVGEEDAETVFGSLRYEMELTDMSDTFPFSYLRSNEYFDVYTMQQYHDGIEVYGHEIKMTADKAGNLLSVTGDPAELSGFDTTVKLSEEDAYALAEKYLKSEYQISTEVVSIRKKGKRIFLEAVDAPSMGYLFEVVKPLGKDFSAELYRIMVYGNEKKVAFVEELTQNATRSIDLQGQEVMQTLDVDVDENGRVEYLTDSERGILVCDEQGNPANDPDVLAEIDNTGAVDFLANAQRAYNFYEENFGKHVSDVFLYVDEAAKSKLGEADYIFGKSGQATRCTNTNTGEAVGIISANKKLSIYLDGVAHEYSHVMFPNNIPATTPINEGLADLFGELTEDYSDGGFNNSCNWEIISRNIADPRESDHALNMNDVNDVFVEFGLYLPLYTPNDMIMRNVHGMEYYASTIVSHSAYLMTQSINETQALTTEQLANLYYYILDDIYDGWNFTAFRSLVETNALQMNMASYDNGIYTDADDGFVLTDAQFESVVDAFDRVGIERLYDYSLEPDAKIEVYDINNKIYDNYHLEILKSNDGTIAVDEDVRSKKYVLPDLDKGVYQFTLTDLDNEERILTYSVIINDNASGQESKDYESKGKFLTDFRAMEKEAVLVLDVSSSMDGTPLKETKNAAMKFVKTVLNANPEVKISLITYSSNANTILTSTNSKFELYKAISNLRSGGNTYMCEALNSAERILMKNDIKDKYIIFMSDGLPYDSPAPVAAEIREHGIIVCTLGFFHNVDNSQLVSGSNLLNKMASPGYFRNTQNSSDVQYLFDIIARQVSGEAYTQHLIECPVEVTVSYNGETLSSDEENQNLFTSFGSISFLDSEHKAKLLHLDEKANYEICIYGTGIGTMNYTVSYVDENRDYTDVRTFEDVPIQEQTIISTRSVESSRTILEVDTDGDGKFDLQYTGSAGKQGEVTENRTWLIAVILTGAILTAWLILEIVLLIRRIKRNRVCAECGSPVTKKGAKFCAKCGKPVNIYPLFPKWTRPVGKQKAICILQLAVVLGCVLFTTVNTSIYCSAANTVFLQLRNAELVSAEMLYQNSVREKTLPRFYLSAVTDVYLNIVERAHSNEKIGTGEVEIIYQTVASMDMGHASDSARTALELLSEMEHVEEIKSE